MNWLRSSALRAALVSVATSAVILAVFAGAAWWKLREVRQQSLDSEMEETGNHCAVMARWSLAPAVVEARLNERLGRVHAEGRAFAITVPGRAPSLSENWPAGLDPESLPHSKTVITWSLPGGPDGGPRRGPGGGPGRRGGPEDEDNWWDDRPPRGEGPGRDGPPGDMGPGRPQLYSPVYSTVVSGGKTWRTGTFGHAGSGVIIRLALDVDVYASDLTDTARSFLLALPATLLLAAAGAWYAARRSLAPVQQLTSHMSTLSLTVPNKRLEASEMDREYSGIIAAYNDMLARLERSYQQATRFSADASHELKTPLAVMRATVESGLRECTDGSSEQRTYAGLLDELDQLQAIIEGLLLLSRADAGLLATSRERMDLSTWLHPLMEDAGLMAEEHGLTQHATLQPGLDVLADPVLLYRAVHNLLRNAVAYNKEGGGIYCSLTNDSRHALLTVANDGTPIPPAERDRIFDRFVRGAAAGGTGHGKGLGIGLSLAREIALAHGGSLTLEPEDAAGRTVFALRLPLADEAAQQEAHISRDPEP